MTTPHVRSGDGIGLPLGTAAHEGDGYAVHEGGGPVVHGGDGAAVHDRPDARDADAESVLPAPTAQVRADTVAGEAAERLTSAAERTATALQRPVEPVRHPPTGRRRYVPLAFGTEVRAREAPGVRGTASRIPGHGKPV